jgi:hypothetical protein
LHGWAASPSAMRWANAERRLSRRHCGDGHGMAGGVARVRVARRGLAAVKRRGVASKLPRELGHVDICGIPHAIVEATPAERPELQGNFGVYLAEKQQVLVDASMPPELWMHTLIHEVGHGIWAHSGVAELHHGGDYEEQFIKIWTSHWIAALKSLRQLKVNR